MPSVKAACVALLLLAIAPVAYAQEPSSVDERYVVRTVEGTVMLIDLRTGWTWRRLTANSEKPPRWHRIDRFADGEEARDWVEGHTEVTPDPNHAQVVPWASEILLGPEFGGRNAEKLIIRRWVTSPTISVFGGTETHAQLVKEAVTKINLALKPATSIKLKPISANNERAAIKVRFMPYADFPEFCRKNKLHFSGVDDAFFWNGWDQKGRFTDATVLVSTDRSRPAKLKHLVLEEITQTLGPMNDSPLKRDSIFFSGFSTVPDLSPDDKQLLRLLYKRMKVGEPGSRLKRAIHKYWKFEAPKKESAP